MKTSKIQSKQFVVPDIGPKNWITGRSLGYLGDIQYPGGQKDEYFQAKDRQKSDRFLKNKK